MDPFTAHTIIRDGTFVALAAIFGIGFPLARAYGRCVESGTGAAPLRAAEASDARMERIERAVEAMSLEVERVAEGQRFLTRLLSDPARVKPPDERL
ncbi:MAG: hypothetical protein M3R65_06440 [Gemmatimonadota bacterium]|nr:hypothetical protein [Gemmatimonadota bacterium]